MVALNVKVNIDYFYCKRCGICHAFCPQQVFSLLKDGSPEVSFPEKCTYCRLCDLRCPDFAISLEVLT